MAQIVHARGSGIYDVYFTTRNTGRLHTGRLAGGMTPGTISAYGGEVASDVVQVQTADASGTSADHTFQLIVSW